jgi:aryl-phospho-beta-D-glucosidase BglC (GH1 family)/chitodextrinase
MENRIAILKNLRILMMLKVFIIFCSLNSFAQYPAGSPVAINGKLKVTGTKLTNECGNPVQLRGMSSHGIQWFPNCYSGSALDALAGTWKIDVFRVAMYVQEGGYVNNPTYWKGWIDNMVTECGKRGIYCIIDWHILNPGDPMANINEARDFWTYMSAKHAGKKHVLYEICNEPNGVDWTRVKSYADDIIPRIRTNDPSTVVIVGTPNWSQDVDIAANNKLNYSNIMYTLHFYSGTHTDWLRTKANTAISKGLALFVTEFGTSLASGDGGPYLSEGDKWISWMASNNISWCNWSFADKAEVSAALTPGSCGGNWNSTTQSGTWIKQKLTSPADNFVCANSNQPPAVSVTSPANGAAFTAPASLTVTANASDIDGTVSKVEFFNGSTKLGEDLSSPYSFSWSGMTAGSYTITAKATDNSGAATTSSAVTITVSGTTVNTPPSVSISSPLNGSSFVAPANITITANASDANGTVSRVEFYNGTTRLGEDLTSPYSFTWSGVTAGSYSITAKATDNSAAITTSAAVSITVTTSVNTNIPPTVTITSPVNGSQYSSGDNITISANASDADGNISKVEFYNGTTKLGEDLTSPYSFSWRKVKQGTYALTAKATDNKGAVTTSATVNITAGNVTPPANQLPVVSVTSPVAGTTYNAPATVTINATASDADGTISKVEFFNGTTKLGEDLTSPYSYIWNNVAAGTYSISAKATDNSGAAGSSSAVSITVSNNTNTNCRTSAVPAAVNWIPGNSWGDQNNGSVITNTTDALKVTHRQYGMDNLWIGETGNSVSLQSGVVYTVSFDVLSDAVNPLSGIDIGFGFSFNWDGPVLTQPVTPVASGFSSTLYTRKLVNITSSTTGSAILSIKLKWAGQVSQNTSTYIKNISICAPAGSPALRMDDNTALAASEASVAIGENPFTENTTVIVNGVDGQPLNISILDISGRTVIENRTYKTNEVIYIGQELKTGVYILKASFGDKSEIIRLIKD